MRSSRFALILVLMSTATAFADLKVVENRQRLTVDCTKDPSVTVLGNHSSITLTGMCKKVSLLGNHNTVSGSVDELSVSGNHNGATLDTVNLIKVPGNHNSVTYKGPSDPKKKTKIGTVGKFNRINRAG